MSDVMEKYGWRTIKTAPEQGFALLPYTGPQLGSGMPDVVVARRPLGEPKSKHWVFNGGIIVNPKWWQPLPWVSWEEKSNG